LNRAAEAAGAHAHSRWHTRSKDRPY
jgi:hypothetical protein